MLISEVSLLFLPFLPDSSLFPVCVCRRLKGGYRALDMGLPHEAMVDMTGGVAEVLNISLLPRDLPAFLKDLLSKGALINCANCQVQPADRLVGSSVFNL